MVFHAREGGDLHFGAAGKLRQGEPGFLAMLGKEHADGMAAIFVLEAGPGLGALGFLLTDVFLMSLISRSLRSTPGIERSPADVQVTACVAQHDGQDGLRDDDAFESNVLTHICA